MHNYYSNHAYMHGYYNMCIYYFYNLFSFLLSLSLGFGHSHLTLSFFIWSNHSSIAIDHQTTAADKSSNHADRWSSNHQTKASPIIKPHQSNHLCVSGWVGDDLAWLVRWVLNGFRYDSCGDVRFAPCTNCNGSRKVFDEEEDRVQRCLECNENGLIRCPDCSSWKMWK